MKKTEIMNKVTRSLYKVKFGVQKHSPEILMVTGVIGCVGAAVMACKATTKLNDILEETKNNIETINDAAEDPEIIEKGYTPEDAKNDIRITYTKTAVEIAKLYGPAVLVGSLSIAAIFASNNIMRKRNVALAAAFTTLDQSFKDYRNRVIERFGADMDKELRFNIKAKDFEETVINEDGTETTVTKTVEVVDPNAFSEYARIYDAGCAGWNDIPEYSLVFLKQTQSWANNKLQREGRLYLNEVYEALGFPKTQMGQVVGWIYDEVCPNGDNFVDFGIFDANKEKTRDFVNGYEKAIILDFNVDGVILDLA